MRAANCDAHAVIAAAKAAGVYVFSGGINDSVAPVVVAVDGTLTKGGYPSGPPWTRAGNSVPGL